LVSRDLLSDPPSAALVEGFVPIPTSGRTFSSHRRIRLSDMDAHGRLRLDAVARYLQDVAIEDVEETGWGLPEHVWFIRHIRIAVLEPFLADRELELVTWCSGLAAIAAGRRWSLVGDRGGRTEVDSVWIHLGPDQRPARLDGFDVYAEATGGRTVSTRLELPDPEPDGHRVHWPLRSTDVDLHGHVNNAAYWHAVEARLEDVGIDPRRALLAKLDYRGPIDADDDVHLVETLSEGGINLGFVTAKGVRAVARVDRLD
jgi:acyl-ACP thioesterase